MGARLENALIERIGQHPHVGDIRGRGLFIGVELVADRETKAPFDPTRRIHGKVERFAFENGLVCYPMGGTIDGKTGDHVLLAPPFIITDGQIDELTDKFSSAVNMATAA